MVTAAHEGPLSNASTPTSIQQLREQVRPPAGNQGCGTPPSRSAPPRLTAALPAPRCCRWQEPSTLTPLSSCIPACAGRRFPAAPGAGHIAAGWEGRARRLAAARRPRAGGRGAAAAAVAARCGARGGPAARQGTLCRRQHGWAPVPLRCTRCGWPPVPCLSTTGVAAALPLPLRQACGCATCSGAPAPPMWCCCCMTWGRALTSGATRAPAWPTAATASSHPTCGVRGGGAGGRRPAASHVQG